MKRFAVFLILLNGVFAFPPWMVSQATSATSKPDTASHDLLVLQTRIASQEPLTWVFTGDSVTQGALWTGGLRTYPEIFSERIRWEMHRNRDIIVNTAISGNKTEDILQDFDWRVAHLHPDVVSLMIGMNDCTRGPEGEKAFEENLSQLIARIHALGAIPVLHTTSTTLPDPKRTDLPAYNAIIRKVALSQRLILVDHWQYWQGNRTAANLNEWLGNAIHPNGLGHIQIAHELFRTLGIFDPESQTGKFGIH